MKSHSGGISKKHRARYITVFAVMLALVVSTCSPWTGPVPGTGCQKREHLSPKVDAAVEEFRSSVPAIMKKGKIPGCAFALVDKKGIIWAEGFGYADCKRRTLVTPDTLFCLQSVSKTLTATAVLLATQEGLVDLDEPVTTYLPDFKVNSRYEKNPEQKITLRHLLSHTAGFPREATIGNFAEPTGDFEERVRSIYDTWLMCPVGKAFNYSNIGVDLAAYVLQAVSGMSFERYMTERLFRPLSMSNSIVGHAGPAGRSSRATGYTTGIKSIPSLRPSLGAGDVFSSVADYAKIIQLYLNKGTIEGTQFLDESLLDAMNTPHAVLDPPNIYYGLGIGIDKQTPKGATLRHGHTGGGRWIYHRLFLVSRIRTRDGCAGK